MTPDMRALASFLSSSILKALQKTNRQVTIRVIAVSHLRVKIGDRCADYIAIEDCDENSPRPNYASVAAKFSDYSRLQKRREALKTPPHEALCSGALPLLVYAVTCMTYMLTQRNNREANKTDKKAWVKKYRKLANKCEPMYLDRKAFRWLVTSSYPENQARKPGFKVRGKRFLFLLMFKTNFSGQTKFGGNWPRCSRGCGPTGDMAWWVWWRAQRSKHTPSSQAYLTESCSTLQMYIKPLMTMGSEVALSEFL